MQTRFRRRLSASLSCALVVAAVSAGMARAETLIVERPMRGRWSSTRRRRPARL